MISISKPVDNVSPCPVLSKIYAEDPVKALSLKCNGLLLKIPATGAETCLNIGQTEGCLRDLCENFLQLSGSTVQRPAKSSAAIRGPFIFYYIFR
jgi:hypothetical protein